MTTTMTTAQQALNQNQTECEYGIICFELRAFVLVRGISKFQAICRGWIERNKKEEEEPICCVGCGKDGVYPEDFCGDTMCPDCWTEEKEGDVFTCNCCGEEDIDNEHGVDCQSCGESVCDECMIADEDDPHCKTDRCKKCEQDEEEDEDRQYFKVADGGNPDVEYFNTLDEAKAFCDKHESLDYGLIMLCDWEKKEIGDWGDFEEEEEEEPLIKFQAICRGWIERQKEEEVVEFDTCVGCEKTVQVVYKNRYSIANCDCCDKMLCRECLDGGVEGKCVYCDEEVEDNSLTYEVWKNTPAFSSTTASWSKQSIKLLKSVCKERRLKKYSKLKKEELLRMLYLNEYDDPVEPLTNYLQRLVVSAKTILDN